MKPEPTVQDLFIAIFYYLPKDSSIRKDRNELHKFFYRQQNRQEYSNLVSRMEFDVFDGHFICESIDDIMANMVESGYIHMVLSSKGNSYGVYHDELKKHFENITKNVFSEDEIERIKKLTAEFYRNFIF